MDPAKLKVVELRAELSHRGLDTKGNKAVLVERLRKALEEETGDVPEETTILETDTEDAGDTSLKETCEVTPESSKSLSSTKTPGRSARCASMTPVKTPTRSLPKGALTLTPVRQLSPVKTPVVEKQQEKKEVPIVAESAPEQPEIVEELEATPLVAEMPEIQKESMLKSAERERCTLSSEKTLVKQEENPVKETAESKENRQVLKESPLKFPDKAAIEGTESAKDINISVESSLKSPSKFNENLNKTSEESEVCYEKLQESPETVSETLQENVKSDPEMTVGIQEDEPFQENVEISEEVSEETSEFKKAPMELNKEEETNEVTSVPSNKIEIKTVEETMKEEKEEDKGFIPMEEENIENIEKDNVLKQDEQDVKMKDIKQEEDIVARDKERKDRKDRKRKRSPSPQEERHRTPPPIRPDNEPEIDDETILLSWYDSDLNLIINKENFLSATPMHSDGFGYIWAGARASYGFTSGKVYYEIKVTEHCPITLQDEINPHVLRVGWSVINTSMQLGEDKLSYGYGGTGKKSTDNKFVDYGPEFSKDDIIGCYLDMTNDSTVNISYTINGNNLGIAFNIPKEELEGRALFPHILTKNCSFTCNFGQGESWSQEILEGYSPVGRVELKNRVPGPRRPEKKEDCEMIMMCGLPASGKTVWASKYAVEHPEKMYNILGTNNLIEKMKVMGLPRKRNYHGRWEVLIDKCTRALNKLLEMACSRRRNFILDQTNVYPSAQRRKMRHFYGYQRRAIVIVPTDEEFKLRTSKREAIEGKDVPDSAVLEMKANFSAPTVGESFDVVDWVELGEEEAKKLIEKYNKEGKEAGFGQQQTNKRPRFERSDSHRDSRDSRSSRDSRDSRDHRDRRSGYPDRNRNAGWRGSSSASGWRDRQQRGGHMRHSGYGGSPGGWRGRSGPLVPSHRGTNDRRGSGGDRRSGNDRSRSVQSRQAGWGPMSSYHNSQQQVGGWGQQGSSWSNNQSQQGSWGQQGNWGQQQWGNWKSYGQGSYNQSGYNQQSYGNGNNWGNWNQQYYNQYWGQQQQQQQTGQPTAAGGQATTTSGSTTMSHTTNSASTYGYSQDWQGYAQAYTFPAQSTSTQHAQQ